MAGATQLSIYNGALAAMGERQLLALTENRASRRALDDQWVRGGLNDCLSAGLWNFATRSAEWDYGQDFTPPFGYQCAYELPVDWLRAKMVCEDPYMVVPHIRCRIENGYLFSDLQTLYVSWVSNDVQFGMNMGNWPVNFCKFVECQFADWTVMQITQSKESAEKVADKLKRALQKAKGTDAMEEPTQFLPPGTWSQARHGRRTWSDMGNPFALIG